MDWKALGAAFTTVFLAELGDKTQLATLGLAMGRSKLAVFAGATAGLALATALAVFAAHFLEGVVPVTWLRRAGGVLLIVMGILFLATSATTQP
jgi:putative Ca2+/H+ antiporter (TMEM165/GDT1 family)